MEAAPPSGSICPAWSPLEPWGACAIAESGEVHWLTCGTCVSHPGAPLWLPQGCATHAAAARASRRGVERTGGGVSTHAPRQLAGEAWRGEGRVAAAPSPPCSPFSSNPDAGVCK